MEMHDLLQISQIIGSIATPLVALFLGFRISRQLELSKQSLSKEKEWQTKWADEFLLRATTFNNTLEDFTFSLFLVGQLSTSPGDPRASKMDEMNVRVWDARDGFQRAEWSLKSHLQFAPRHGDAVLTAASEVAALVRNLAKEKRGELDPISKALFRFNDSVRDAHRELLAL